jgi:hypothetical protein
VWTGSTWDSPSSATAALGLTEEEIVEGGINLIGYVNSEFGLGRTSRCFIDAIQKSEIPINIIEKRLGNKISSNHYKTTNKCNYGYTKQHAST